MARTFGAPDTVPAGNAARRTSKAVSPFRSFPTTFDTMCMTWEYRSITMSSFVFTVPHSATRPTSFRPRSTSITCSAISLGSDRSSASRRRSSSGSAPRGRVPAIGRSWMSSPSSRTRTSGEEPTTASSPIFSRYM